MGSKNKLKRFKENLTFTNVLQPDRQKIIEDINKKKEILEKEINEEIEIVEKEINDLKQKAPEKINIIAMETSIDLLKQVIGVEVNKSSVSAIVEDLSKKNKEKYYGV